MTISDVTENAILNLVYRAIPWANYADNATVGPQTNIAISLHRDDPSDAGTASSNEVAYAGYARVNVPRSAAGWSAPLNGIINPLANIVFPLCVGGLATTATFFGTSFSNGSPPTGPQALLWSGPIVPPIHIQSGTIPRLTTATQIRLE